MEIRKNNLKENFGESKTRSLVKSVIYRVFSVIGTGLLTWLIAKDIKETISITAAIQVFFNNYLLFS